MPGYVIFIDDDTIFLVVERYEKTQLVYKYDNDVQPYIGADPGGNGIFYGRLDRIEKGFIVATNFDIALGTHFLTARFPYDRLLKKEPEGMYWFTQRSLNRGLTLLVDLDVHKSNSEGNRLDPVTLTKGTLVYPEYTNLRDTIIFTTQNGDWYIITNYSHSKSPQEIGGISIDQIFDGMPNTGGQAIPPFPN